MELNGHELEMKYVNYITALKQSKNSKVIKLMFCVKLHQFKNELKERLSKLEKSFNDGFIEKESYQIWHKMITEVI